MATTPRPRASRPTSPPTAPKAGAGRWKWPDKSPPGLQLQGSYTRFRSKDSNGRRLNTWQPLQQFKLFAIYRLPALPRLSLNAGARWQSRTFSSDRQGQPSSPLEVIGGYTVWDAGVRYDFTDRLNLNLSVSNLTDKTYRVTTDARTYGPPRNMHATLRYHFN